LIRGLQYARAFEPREIEFDLRESRAGRNDQANDY